jgi:Flp pilus assembly pilin Flp
VPNASRTTLKNNGKIRPRPNGENAFARASGKASGPDAEPSPFVCFLRHRADVSPGVRPKVTKFQLRREKIIDPADVSGRSTAVLMDHGLGVPFGEKPISPGTEDPNEMECDMMTFLKKTFARLAKDEKGVTLVEYAIALTLAVGVGTLALDTLSNDVEGELGEASAILN